MSKKTQSSLLIVSKKVIKITVMKRINLFYKQQMYNIVKTIATEH
jgi:hypothetical protein